MESLAWEYGAAPQLRKSIVATLSALPEPDTRHRKFPFAVAVCFRRAAVGEDMKMPPDYTYKIGVAALQPVPGLVGSMLASRRTGAEVHYDILRVQVLLPVKLAALRRLGRLDDAPMCMQLMQNDTVSTTSSGPARDESELSVINAYEAVQSQEPIYNEYQVARAILVDAGQRTWVQRPARLLAAYGLRAALAMALDGPTSPCASLAAYYNMMDNSRVVAASGNVPVVWYEGIEESALTTQFGNKTCSLRVEVAGVGVVVFMGPIPSDTSTTMPDTWDYSNMTLGEPGIIPEFNKSLSAAVFNLSEVRVAGPGFQLDRTVTLESNGLLAVTNFDAFPGADKRQQQFAGVITKLRELLANVHKGLIPISTTQSSALPVAEHVILSRDRRIVEQLFPAPVVEQLRAAIIGAWCYRLFIDGAERSAFWRNYCQMLASRMSSNTKGGLFRGLVALDSDRVTQPFNVECLSVFKNEAYLFDETKQLDATLRQFVIPAAGLYVFSQKEPRTLKGVVAP